MNRRIALKQLGFITAGAMLLPSCIKQMKPLSITLKNVVVTGDDEALIAEVAETIIPATDIPGAKAMQLERFVLRMVDDCQDEEHRQQFLTGLSQLDEALEKKYSKSFEDCTTEERVAFFHEIEENRKKEKEGEKKEPELMKDGKENQVPAFYSMVKRYTVQGFLSSEYVMTNVLVYNMVPGRFQGCLEIKDKNDIQTVIG